MATFECRGQKWWIHSIFSETRCRLWADRSAVAKNDEYIHSSLKLLVVFDLITRPWPSTLLWNEFMNVGLAWVDDEQSGSPEVALSCVNWFSQWVAGLKLLGAQASPSPRYGIYIYFFFGVCQIIGGGARAPGPLNPATPLFHRCDWQFFHLPTFEVFWIFLEDADLAMEPHFLNFTKLIWFVP